MPEVTPPDPSPDRRTPFEWSLGGLRPADADVARPSFMYKAGQASRERQVRFWQWVAGGLVLLLAVGGVAGVGVMISERQRAEAMVAELRAANRASAVQRVPAVVEAPAAYPVPVEPTDPSPPSRSGGSVVITPPLDEPTPAEIAVALERRRNILVGGLGLIPDTRPQFPAEPGWSQPLTSGVLAVPLVGRKPTDDPPSPPEPR